MKGRRFKKMIKKKIVKKKIVKKAKEPKQAKEPIVEGEIEPRIVKATEATPPVVKQFEESFNDPLKLIMVATLENIPGELPHYSPILQAVELEEANVIAT